MREQLREVSGKAEAVGRVVQDLESIRARVDEAASKAGEPPAGMAELRAELEKVASGGAAGDEKISGLIRMQQVREIYGTRGADQVKSDLGL